jgi:hypothetical protein
MPGDDETQKALRVTILELFPPGPVNVPTLPGVGGKNPERERLWARDTDRLGDYARDYVLEAHCRRPYCEHARVLHYALLLKAFGPDATLAQVRARFRCHKCGMRGSRIVARYLGPHGDGR